MDERTHEDFSRNERERLEEMHLDDDRNVPTLNDTLTEHPMRFEDYLEDKFLEIYKGVKDNFEGSFDYWLSTLDVQEVIDMAEDWGVELVKEVRTIK